MDIKDGLINKPKVTFQILYERGWIDPSADPNTYKWKGKTDKFGHCDESRSKKALISSQPNFLDQKTLLQHYCEKLGVLSECSPAVYYESAREGIRFNWKVFKDDSLVKTHCPSRSKTKFHELVKLVLNKDVLTVAVCKSNTCRSTHVGNIC